MASLPGLLFFCLCLHLGLPHILRTTRTIHSSKRNDARPARLTLEADSPNDHVSASLLSGETGWSLVNGDGAMFIENDKEAVIEMARSSEAQFGNSSVVSILHHLTVLGILQTATASFQMNYIRQWMLVRHDDFQGPVEGWSNDTKANCGTSIDMFLGGHCYFSSGNTTKTYKNLPPHEKVRVTARFHYFDEWNGETAYMLLGGVYGWSETHHWCDKLLTWICTDFGIDVCGTQYPDRLSSPISVEIPHSSSDIEVQFGTTLTRHACDVSWGIDDVMIYVQ